MNLLIRTAPVQGYNKIFDIGEYRMRLTRFGLIKLAAGSSYSGNTGENELALVLIGGCFTASGEGWSFSRSLNGTGSRLTAHSASSATAAG